MLHLETARTYSILLRDFNTWVKFREKTAQRETHSSVLMRQRHLFLLDLRTQNVNLGFLNDFCRPPLDLTHVN